MLSHRAEDTGSSPASAGCKPGPTFALAVKRDLSSETEESFLKDTPKFYVARLAHLYEEIAPRQSPA